MAEEQPEPEDIAEEQPGPEDIVEEQLEPEVQLGQEWRWGRELCSCERFGKE